MDNKTKKKIKNYKDSNYYKYKGGGIWDRFLSVFTRKAKSEKAASAIVATKGKAASAIVATKGKAASAAVKAETQAVSAVVKAEGQAVKGVVAAEGRVAQTALKAQGQALKSLRRSQKMQRFMMRRSRYGMRRLSASVRANASMQAKTNVSNIIKSHGDLTKRFNRGEFKKRMLNLERDMMEKSMLAAKDGNHKLAYELKQYSIQFSNYRVSNLKNFKKNLSGTQTLKTIGNSVI
jgi:hypothetical protein